MTFGKYPFIGYIDLVLLDKTDGEYVVWDHKSKSKFTSEREKKEYLRQLYLYAGYVKEKYGKFPKELTFNMFRANEIVTEPFNETDYEAAVDWFVSTIDKIYETTAFLDKIAISYYEKMKDLSDFKRDDFFCNNLCDSRKSCERSKYFTNKKKRARRTTKSKPPKKQ